MPECDLLIFLVSLFTDLDAVSFTQYLHMEITLNLVMLKGRKNADGTYPIQLQLHVTGESPQRKGIYKCLESDWWGFR
ncbi:hypothetical protein G7074_02075 [Pedobacter sp. HDW13]|uniref:hypothetical protein n=1 Tax=Pedobacter sp. HDW13 TaxID=2714940 RepID=UPI00140CB8E4|nr:hypothetical protein [Pedobacter sp. HDW13]QIL38167.1 hypothetical protein G7074_02075 [Pedobacter sp. HDW13]